MSALANVHRTGCVALLGMIVAAVAWVALTAANAEPLYACAALKKGSLRLVPSPNACNPKKERAVSLNAASQQSPRLVDANGQNLGTLLSWGAYGPESFLEHLKVTLVIDIFAEEDSEAEVFVGCCGEVFWGQDGCTGQPYASVTHSGRLISDWADSPRFYTATIGPSASTIASQSDAGGCFDRTDFTPEPGAFVPVKEVTDSLGFDLPLALPLRIDLTE